MPSGVAVQTVSDRIDLFWSKVIRLGPDDCWEWQAYTNKDGYGIFVAEGKRLLAHRFSYSIEFALPVNIKVLHKCDNPPCVNPNHLFTGTQADNIRDMIQKGRKCVLRGELHPRSKLTKSDVNSIRFRYWLGGVTLKQLGEEFKISDRTVGSIVNYENWR